MTKMEIVNRMIILGCIKEKDREYWLNETYLFLVETYIRIVPIRLEYLANEKVNRKD